MAVELSSDETRACLYALTELRGLYGARPVPYPVITAHQRLELAYRCHVSPPRHQNESRTPELEDEWITTKEAAQILGWNHRRVQRHRADLDGHRLGDRLVYPAHAVREYAKQIGAQHD